MWRESIACFVAVLVLVGCGASAADLRRAREARYNYYAATLMPLIAMAARARIAEIKDDGTRLETAWQEVSEAPLSQHGGRVPQTRYFERYSIRIVGERPVAIEVRAFAARWHTGDALPVDLAGTAEPAWLEGRRNHIELRIHGELEPYAVR